jgi:hypothetical protein
MLARTPKAVCLECGLPWTSPAFVAHAGIREHGPAYWSDRGILCSVDCAHEHFRKRKADRTFVAVPLDCPVDVES